MTTYDVSYGSRKVTYGELRGTYGWWVAPHGGTVQTKEYVVRPDPVDDDEALILLLI